MSFWGLIAGTAWAGVGVTTAAAAELNRIDGPSDVIEHSALFLPETGATQARAGACTPIGDQRTALILVQLPGNVETVQAPEFYSDLVFSTTRFSVNGFFREASSGRTSFSGDTFGWFTLPTHPGCDFNRMVQATFQAIAGQVDLSSYNRVAVYAAGQSGCSFAGVSTLGCRTLALPGGGTYSGSFSWSQTGETVASNPPALRTRVMAHELGHALGLWHSRYHGNTITLHEQGLTGILNEPVGPLTGSWPGDFRLEYGDLGALMGASYTSHPAAPHKARLGWLTDYALRDQLPGPYYVDVAASGDFWLEAASDLTTGIKALRVPRTQDGDAYWLEFRQKRGYDSSLLDLRYDAAVVHLQTASSGGYTDLADMRPGDGTASESSLLAGQTFSDPYHPALSFTTVGVEAGRLHVRVDLGATRCDAMPATGYIPANGSTLHNGGQTAVGAFVFKNPAPASCPPRSFHVGVAVPTGWVGRASEPDPTVGSGAAKFVRVEMDVPKKAKALTFGVKVSAASAPGQAGSADSSITVTKQRLALSRSPATDPLALGQTVTLRAKVTQNPAGTKPTAGVRVTFTLKRPAGDTVTSVAVTNATGDASWSYPIGTGAGDAGAYALTASGSYRGASAKLIAPISFDAR